MAAAAYQETHRAPVVGMTLAFKDEATGSLAGIPARVIHIWPRFQSGDYLVTLEYPEPVRTKEGPIAHIDAFMSDLCQPIDGLQ